MQITLNQPKSLFVLQSGGGTSYLGFQVVFNRLIELCARLTKAGKPVVVPQSGEMGTIHQYEQYCTSMADYANMGDTRTWFESNTPRKVRTIIENYRESRQFIRVFYGDPETGRDWMEEFGTTGIIGRSTGAMKVPLLLANNDDDGSSAMLVNNIVRLVDVASGLELYSVKNYHLLDLTIADSGSWDDPTCTHGVWAKEGDELTNVANFQSYAKAAHFIAFISGECNESCH